MECAYASADQLLRVLSGKIHGIVLYITKAYLAVTLVHVVLELARLLLRHLHWGLNDKDVLHECMLNVNGMPAFACILNQLTYRCISMHYVDLLLARTYHTSKGEQHQISIHYHNNNTQ
jgi:hypothetical protein